MQIFDICLLTIRHMLMESWTFPLKASADYQILIRSLLSSCGFDFAPKNELSAKDSFLFSIGIIAYSCRLFFLDNFMLNRIGYYFLLLSILPLYVYMKHLYMCYKGRMWCYCMAAVFLLFYFLKTVLFAEGEYDYQSIYF